MEMRQFIKDLRRVGIEIEMENPSDYSEIMDSDYWHVENEGSIRNGIEAVSSILDGSSINEALCHVEDTLNGCENSWRCGVHVHVDVGDLSREEVANVISGYILLERLLFAWEGTNRNDSKFCVPVAVSSHILEGYAHWVYDIPARGSLTKYSALNLLPIERQGSVEFRFMSTPDNINRIKTFAYLCSGLVSYFAKTESDNNPLMLLSELGADDLLEDIYPPSIVRQLKAVSDYDGLIWQGLADGNLFQSMLERRKAREPEKKQSSRSRSDLEEAYRWLAQHIQRQRQTPEPITGTMMYRRPMPAPPQGPNRSIEDMELFQELETND